jgi:hypothetical protein
MPALSSAGEVGGLFQVLFAVTVRVLTCYVDHVEQLFTVARKCTDSPRPAQPLCWSMHDLSSSH